MFQNKMQSHLHNDIKRLEEENERLREQIEENEKRICSLQLILLGDAMPPPPPRLLEETDVWGQGEPPIAGALPARTMRDKNGNIHVLFCRTYAGEGWVYTPVADGWIVITNVNHS